MFSEVGVLGDGVAIVNHKVACFAAAYGCYDRLFRTCKNAPFLFKNVLVDDGFMKVIGVS